MRAVPAVTQARSRGEAYLLVRRLLRSGGGRVNRRLEPSFASPSHPTLSVVARGPQRCTLAAQW